MMRAAACMISFSRRDAPHAMAMSFSDASLMVWWCWVGPVDLDTNWGTKFPLSELHTPRAPSYSMHSARDVTESNNTGNTAVPLE